ncbi:MAG: DUF2628 domain-containing protein [Pirellulales bacterium]|nr:DUF2628 domain-containing protein [Pirellulales bacterium]
MSDSQEFDQKENPYAAPDYSPTEFSQNLLTPQNALEAELQAFVGPKADYYLQKWASIIHAGDNNAGFNWAAFFIAPLWLAYRKMYLVFTLFWSFICVEAILEDFVCIRILGHEEVPTLVDFGSELAIDIICGMLANRCYLWHAKKQIAEIRAQGLEGDQLLWQITKRGGTSMRTSLGLNFLASVVCVWIWDAYEILECGF